MYPNLYVRNRNILFQNGFIDNSEVDLFFRQIISYSRTFSGNLTVMNSKIINSPVVCSNLAVYIYE